MLRRNEVTTNRGAGMNGHINDPKHWRARAEEARILANQMNDSEAKAAMLRSLRTTSTLLAGPKTGPCGVQTLPNRIGGIRMSIEMVLLIMVLTFGIGFVLNWWFDKI